jgi:hypothetical protein
MSESANISVGTFVSQRLVAKKQAVAATNNKGGWAAIYPEIAREVLVQYSSLTPAEKASVGATLKGDAELTRVRAGIDPTMALREVSRILGLARG